MFDLSEEWRENVKATYFQYILMLFFIMGDTNQSSFASDILRQKNKLLLNPWNKNKQIFD